jgi:hypothetical protein
LNPVSRMDVFVGEEADKLITLWNTHARTHTCAHTHTHIYIYIRILAQTAHPLCVYVCLPV